MRRASPHTHDDHSRTRLPAEAIDAVDGNKRPRTSATGIQRVQDFLALAEATVCVNYPASAKAYLLHAVPEPAAGKARLLASTGCRVKGPDGKRRGEAPFLEHQLVALKAMHDMQAELCVELGIACPAASGTP